MGSPNVTRMLAQQERTIAWLARKTGVSVSYAWKMLNGSRPLTPEFRERTAKVLNVPEDILFAESTGEAA